MLNWTNIIIEHIGTINFNIYNKAQTLTCNWCNQEAMYLVTRTSTFSWNTYTDRACTICASSWGELPQCILST